MTTSIKRTLLTCLLALSFTGCVDPEVPAGGYWTCPGAQGKCPEGTTCQGGICKTPIKDATGAARDKQASPDRGETDMGEADLKLKPDQKSPIDSAQPSDMTVPVDQISSTDKPSVVFPCSWTKQTAPLGVGTAELNDVWGTGPTNVFAVGANGSLLHFNGTGWTKESVGTYAPWIFNGVGGINGKVFITSGINILERTGAGKLTVAFKESGTSMLSIGAVSSFGLLAAGTSGYVFIFQSSTWKRLQPKPGISGSIHAMWGNGLPEVWLGAQNTIYTLNPTTSSAAVVTKKSFSATPTPNMHDIWSEANQVYAVSATPNGKVYHLNSAKKWQTLDPGNTEALWGIWGSSITQIWITGTEGIWFFDGQNWGKAYTAPKGEGVKAIHGFGPKNVWAVGRNGTILRCN